MHWVNIQLPAQINSYFASAPHPHLCGFPHPPANAGTCNPHGLTRPAQDSYAYYEKGWKQSAGGCYSLKATDNLVFQAAYNERYFVIQVTCNMNTEGQTCNENSGHWQGPVERVQVNKLNQWSGRWHKYTKKESSHFTI